MRGVQTISTGVPGADGGSSKVVTAAGGLVGPYGRKQHNS